MPNRLPKKSAEDLLLDGLGIALIASAAVVCVALCLVGAVYAVVGWLISKLVRSRLYHSRDL